MRFLVAGILIVCILTTSALAQAGAEGEVESIGFEGSYRPNCWTPMKIKLSPRTGAPRTYRIAVAQEDLDKDKVTFSRPFTLSGNPEGQKLEERVWAYFRPQPFGIDTPQSIKVFLYNEKGEQEVIVRVPPSVQMLNLDEAPMGSRGKRLVLMVGTAQSTWMNPYNEEARLDLPQGGERPRGVNEDVDFQRLRPSELPGDSKGFECVDAIVWLDADPTQLSPESQAAIEDWVRDGGHLVVSQSADWQKTKGSFLNPLLPVDLEAMGEEQGLKSLNNLVQATMRFENDWYDFPALYEKLRKGESVPPSPPWVVVAQNPLTRVTRQVINDPWAGIRDKKQGLAKASARPGAVVNHWCADDPSAPYLARWLVGLGTVTWVAQDLGSPSVATLGDRTANPNVSAGRADLAELGWAQVWDRVFDWPNRTMNSARVRFMQSEGTKREYEALGSLTPPPTPDLSRPMLQGMNHAGRGAGYVAIAVLFFIGYWVVAGPGSYFFLLARKRTQYSWLTFALCAGVATVLTMGIVKLVLRGNPEVKHVTFVRVGPDGQAVAYSNFGLYIPRDGVQEIELKDTLPKRASYVTPFPLHPAHLPAQSGGGFVSYLEYDVPVRDRSSTEPAMISVPYRSTLKKFQAKWVGKVKGSIAGRPRISPGAKLSGTLSNETGVDLHSVYLVYLPSIGEGGRDPMMIHLPGRNGQAAWPAGASLSLTNIENGLDTVKPDTELALTMIGWTGRLNLQWAEHRFNPGLRRSNFGEDDLTDQDQGALLMTLFDLLEPSRVMEQNQSRFELRRRSGRQLDASDAVSTGQLLVFARSGENAPLPFKMRVAGDEPVASEGVNYWQVIVPLERPAVTPATQPGTVPTTQPTTQPEASPDASPEAPTDVEKP